MIENHIYHGSCLEVIRTFQDESIDCVITSPPYWQLRDYGWNGQWGLESNFEMYLDNLWSLMDEINRVLKKNGTVWINLGDTYGTTSGGSNQEANGSYKQYGKINHKNRNAKQNKPKKYSKSLLLIPHRFAIGCMERGWIIRNDIVWAKRNGMPESVRYRFSKKHEYFMFMVKSEKYFFDLDLIKDKTTTYDAGFRNRDSSRLNNTPGRSKMGGLKKNNYHMKNPGSVSDFWDVPTKPSSKKHYASYNFDLINKPIVAGCPKGGIVLDPFCGTATTGVRALQLGRKFIGIEGNEDYVKIANEQMDMERLQTKIF